MIFPGVEIGIGDEGTDGEVVGDVTVEDNLVERVDDLGGPRLCLPPTFLHLLDDRVQGRHGAHLLEFVLAVHGPAAVQVGHHILFGDLEIRALAGRERRANDLVFGIPVGCLRVLTDVHVGETSCAIAQLRHGRIGQSEAVERHVALTLVVPLVDHTPPGNPGRFLLRGHTVVLVVDLRHHPFEYRVAPRYHVRSRRRIPQRHGILEHLLAGAHGVERAPVANDFVEIVNVISVVRHAARSAVLFHHQRRILLVHLHELALKQGPLRGGTNL